ncbi:MAG: fibronectin type III domain-containing protein [Patescibacteria group bacterium]|jgi:hypothetical protein
MQRRNIVKITIILSLAIGLVLFREEWDKNGGLTALAGTGENIRGFAWSENIGWVSFNSRDCDIDGDGIFEGATETGGSAPAGCPTAGTAVDYGVNVDSGGDFSGYGWSENIGWLVFERIKVCDGDKTVVCANNGQCVSQGLGSCNFINPPGFPYNEGSGKIAHYDSSTKQVNGWAYILALGDNGWLKLKKEASDSGAAYGVSIDTDNGGKFKNWAWNGNTAYGTGIGWLSFNCEDAGTCAAAEYHVQAPVPAELNITSIDQHAVSPCDSCSCLKINWTVGAQSQQDGFNLYENTIEVAGGLNPDILSYLRNGLEPGTAYVYKVRAYSSFGYVEDTDTGTTKSICSIGSSSITGIGVCPDTINLSWSAPASACAISYYRVARCDCATTACANCPDSGGASYIELASGGCGDPKPVGAACFDDTFTAENNAGYFRYIVSGHCNEEDIDGDWSLASSKIQPCPKAPKWIEKKVE